MLPSHVMMPAGNGLARKNPWSRSSQEEQSGDSGPFVFHVDNMSLGDLYE